MSKLLRAVVASSRRQVLVLSAAAVVHCAGAVIAAAQRADRDSKGRGASAATKPARASSMIFGQGTDQLPPAVIDMRAAILAAVDTGDIQDIKQAMDLNELRPELGAPPGSDPIAYLKAISGDGEGREVLAILGRVLDSGWASIPGGRDIENNRIFVWPQFAEMPLDALTPAQEVALYKLVTPAEAKSMRERKRWTWWRLSIGADGVWHLFTKAQ